MNLIGPAGDVEVRVDAPAEAASGRVVVLCHPHPRYGGNMYDGVIDTAARVFLARGDHTVRFNFRGVGASGGSFDDGIGEIDDLEAVARWAVSEHGDGTLWLAGYSFGASVAWGAISRPANPIEAEHVVLIAPPLGTMMFQGTADVEVDAVVGDHDPYVERGAFEAWTANNRVTVHTVPGADHFFSGCTAALAEAVRSAAPA